jgi:hypothetical protein
MLVLMIDWLLPGRRYVWAPAVPAPEPSGAPVPSRAVEGCA